MFDGMPDQFYQFLAATTTSRTTVATNNTATTPGSIQLPLSFSLHHHNHHGSFPSYSPPPPPPPPPSFDSPYHLLHHSQFITRNNSQVSKDNETLNLQHDDNVIPRSLILPEIPWSNDEMLALFKIRSSMDNTWFPDFIWENVSRKLAELGFKRSAEKCKEKFEEETRSFNSSIISNNTNNKNNTSNNYRLFGELEELCNNNNDSICHGGGDDHHHPLPLPPSPPPPPRPPPQLPPCLTDEAKHPESLLSQRNECLGGDNEDEDGENSQVGEDMQEKEELGDEEEGEDDTKNGGEDENDNDDDDDNNVEEEHYVEDDDDSEKTEESTKKVIKKRKREKKFEMFKGFCEQIVNKMMAQQEQLHCKILQDMVKRDEEKIAKEEAWKKQEIERLQKELEVRAHEQAIVGDRQAKILHCLNKFNSSPSSSNILDSQFLRETLESLNKVPNLITLSNSSILTHDNSIISAQLPPTTSCTTTTTTHDHNNLSPLPNNTHQTCLEIPTSSSSENVALFNPIRLDNSNVSLPMSSPSMDRVSQNPNILSIHNDLSQIPSLVSSHNISRLDHTSTNATDESDHPKHVRKDDTGKRWPRDEVLALINIRCSLFNNNGGNNDAPTSDRESFSKAPLWERISQKMTELGYKRSAKRCKEKWENINKYFRKTKDLNKKRSIDSRTCPYFHQLSHLYNQGTLVGSSDRPVNQPGSPESHRSMTPSGPQGDSSSNPPNAGTTNNMNGSQGVVQVPGFDFEF